MKSTHRPCTSCGKTDVEGQWWHLQNYFGVSGYFCPKCYDTVARDAYGVLKRPEEKSVKETQHTQARLESNIKNAANNTVGSYTFRGSSL